MSEQLLLPAFENEILEINIEELHFSKDIPPQLLMGRKYGIDVLNLTLVKGYIRSIFANPRVVGYLKTHEPEIYQQFASIVELDSINTDNDSLIQRATF